MRLRIYRQLDDDVMFFGLNLIEAATVSFLFILLVKVFSFPHGGVAALITSFCLWIFISGLKRKYGKRSYLQVLRFIQLPDGYTRKSFHLKEGKLPLDHKSKDGSLHSLLEIESVDDRGVIKKAKGGYAACYSLSPIDGAFLESSDFNKFQSKARGLFTLSECEELTFRFRRTSDFDALIEEKLSLLQLEQSEVKKFLLRRKIEALIQEAAVNQSIQSVSLTLYFESEEKNEEKFYVRAKDKFLDLERLGLKPKWLLEGELESIIINASHGGEVLTPSSYWPKVDISASEIKVEERSVRALSLDKLPEDFSELGMIQALTLMALPIEITTRIRGKETTPIRSKIERKKRVLYGIAARKVSGDPQTESQLLEADALLRRMSEHNEGIAELSFGIIVRSKNPDAIQKIISSIFAERGSLQHTVLKEETLQTFDWFLEMIPGFKGKAISKHTVLSSNALHFCPLYFPYEGASLSPVHFQTRYGTLYGINPVSQSLSNYNMLVSGASGAGKSFFINSLLLQSLSLNPKVWIIDVGGSYNKLVEFLGGKVLSLDAKKGFQLSPFYIAPSSDPFLERRRREHIELIFQEMCRDDSKSLPIEEKALLSKALQIVLEKNVKEPVSAVIEELQKLDGAKRVELLLQRWKKGTFYGDFFDTDKTLELSDDFIVFDLKGLSEYADLSRTVQLLLTSLLWDSLKSRDRFTWIVLDEVAFTLMKTAPHFVDELVSTVRKHFAGVITIVQGLEKITKNEVAGASILNNSSRKVILQQRGDSRAWKEPLGLNSVEVSAIESLQREKGRFSEIFLIDEERRALLRFSPDPLTYWISTSDARDNGLLESRISKFEGDYSEKLIKFIEEGELNAHS